MTDGEERVGRILGETANGKPVRQKCDQRIERILEPGLVVVKPVIREKNVYCPYVYTMKRVRDTNTYDVVEEMKPGKWRFSHIPQRAQVGRYHFLPAEEQREEEERKRKCDEHQLRVDNLHHWIPGLSTECAERVAKKRRLVEAGPLPCIHADADSFVTWLLGSDEVL